MANSYPGARKDAERAGIREKLWSLVCCNSSSTTSPVETGPPSIELLRQSKPGTRETTAKRNYDDVTDTVDSIVDFVLKGVETVGSNLPGVGAVSVVLAAKDKFITDRKNREEADRILKYIEDLCEDARLADGADTPNIDLENVRFIEALQRDFANQKKSKGWRRALDIINANARKADLEAVWKGIERAMQRHGLKVNINSATVIENVLQKLLEVKQKVDAVRIDQLGQMTRDEEKAIDDLLRELIVAKGAKFNSMRTEQTRLVTCTAETRVEVLDTIREWVESEEESREHLFWLNGLAGTGKSTIASTIAKWANQEGTLGGSFFFSQGVPELSSTALVFPTLASQLAEFDYGYKCALYHVLKGDRFAATANLRVQFDTFIRKPFAACRKRRILIMLDALDECLPEADVQEMLRLLLGYNTDSGGLELRIFVTSRPESHIRSVFTSGEGTGGHEKVILHDIDKTTVRNDIATYLRAEFAKMSSDSFKFERKPPLGWPSSSDFERLLSNCGEFFAYAATVVRFIGDVGIGNPVGQLADILRLMDSPSMTATSLNPYLTLDNLYLAVLEQAANKDPREGSVARIIYVVATVLCLRRPMKIGDLALFLGITSDDVRYTLRHLHSVILVPDRDEAPFWIDTNVRFFHQSFPDFLKDQKRCQSDKGFLVDIAVHERNMGSRCIDLNNSLVMGIARHDPVYAAEFWISHFQTGAHPDTGGPSAKGGLWPIINGDELSEEVARLEREWPFDGSWSENARKCMLDAVRDWFTSRGNGSKHVFWLYGRAGVGYPDIGMYIAKWAREERIPAAFSLQIIRPELTIPFLASQLARFNPEYRNALYDITQRDKGMFASSDLHVQLEAYFRRPMALLNQDGKAMQAIIAINAYPSTYPHKLDAKFIQRLVLASDSMGHELRVLIVSKPLSILRAMMKRSNESPPVLYEFDERMDRSGVRTYLKHWLQEHGGALSDKQFGKLLDCCRTSLAFARTALHFIFDEEVGDPNSRLHDILSINERPHTSTDGAHCHLDDLYRLVLKRKVSKNVRKEDIARIRCYVATIICLRRTQEHLLSSDVLEPCLCMEEFHIRVIRRQLSCVEGDMENELCGSLHPSFEEFIQDRERCPDSRFIVDVPAHERFMALKCCSKLRDGGRVDIFNNAYRYPIAHWPSHLRSAIGHDISGDWIRGLELAGILKNKNLLAESYNFQGSPTKILLGEDIDIIPFIRKLVEREMFKPKEAEKILALLRDAEADDEVARNRKQYLNRRRRLLGERVIDMDLGGDGSW